MTRSRWPLLAGAFVLLVALATCRRHGSDADREATAGTTRRTTAAPPLASPTGLPPTPSASATAVPTKPGTSVEEASAALGESMMERLVFREMLVGGYTFNWRRTWILYQTERGARIDVLCQSGVEKIPLMTGKENDESAWKEPVLMRYVGTREGKGTYRMALTAGTSTSAIPSEWECSWMPESFVLSCRSESIAVLRAGAALILDNPSEGVSHWAPSTEERVTAMRCEGVTNASEQLFHCAPSTEQRVTGRDCEGLTNARFGWPPVFAAPSKRAPGIEWVFQHEDASLQKGAYRWLPASQ